MTVDIAQLGARLRRAGMTEAALLSWAGTTRLSALPWRLAGLRSQPPVPAATALALFVAGSTLLAESLRALEPLDDFVAAGLLARDGARVRSLVAVVPLGSALVVCDHHDAGDREELVCWPDDSSYHLATAIGPGRRPRWLDLACGSAFAPLAHPQLGEEIRCIDLNPRAVELAKLGAGLTGCRHLTFTVGDIGAPQPPAALVTCNAPIAGDKDQAIWRRTDRSFFARLWPAARAATAPGGEVIVHCTLDVVPEDLAGEVATVVYTEPGDREFAITWWRPDAPAHRVLAYRELTVARPHLAPRDREDALAGRLVGSSS